MIVIIGQSRSGHNFVYNQFVSWNLGDRAVAKIEGYAPEQITDDLIQQTNPKVEVEFEKTYILVVRDFRNWLASYMMWIAKAKNIVVDEQHMDERIIVWQKIADEARRKTHFLEDKILCRYDPFKHLRAYRRMICSVTGGTYNEHLLNIISSQGGGSSFDRFKYQGKANKMNTDQRYKEILDTEHGRWYTEILKKYEERVNTSRAIVC